VQPLSIERAPAKRGIAIVVHSRGKRILRKEFRNTNNEEFGVRNYEKTGNLREVAGAG
jgi:hypothetical protein